MAALGAQIEGRSIVCWQVEDRSGVSCVEHAVSWTFGCDEAHPTRVRPTDVSWQTVPMPRTTYRLAAALLALALAAAACSDSADETSVDATPDASAETDSGAAEGSADTAGDTGDAAEDSSAAEVPASDLVAPGEQFAPVEIIGTALEPMPAQIPVTEADNDPAIGVVAPELIGSDFDGTPVSISADGTPRMVMFVAHWCPHCQREVPAVKQLIDQGLVPDGLEIVVVSTAVREGDPNYPPQAWLESEQWPGPVLRDTAEFDALIAFGAGGFPYTVYLDDDHRVVARTAGEIPSDILQQIWLATAEA